VSKDSRDEFRKLYTYINDETLMAAATFGKHDLVFGILTEGLTNNVTMSCCIEALSIMDKLMPDHALTIGTMINHECGYVREAAKDYMEIYVESLSEEN